MKKKNDSIDLVENAFVLYVQGKSLLYISKLLKINRHSVERFERQYEWQKRRDVIVEKIKAERDTCTQKLIDIQIDELTDLDNKLEKYLKDHEPESFSVALRGRLKIIELFCELLKVYDYTNALKHEALQFVIEKFFKLPLLQKMLEENKLTESDVRNQLQERLDGYYADIELKKRLDQVKDHERQ